MCLIVLDDLHTRPEMTSASRGLAKGVIRRAMGRNDIAAVACSHEERHESSELGGARGGFGYTVQVPLKNLAPGASTLAVEARSSLSGGGAIVREVAFRIRG